jgi:hypothetical protein
MYITKQETLLTYPIAELKDTALETHQSEVPTIENTGHSAPLP